MVGTTWDRPRRGLTFGDVLIEPKYSDIESRTTIDVTSHYLGENRLPIISAPMDYVTGFKMAETLSNLGAYGIVSRFGDAGPIDLDKNYKYGIATGTKDIYSQIRVLQTISRLSEEYMHILGGGFYGFHSICIDVAHGDHKNVLDSIKAITDSIPGIYIIAGNVATVDGFKRLAEAGANAIRVGIGPGSACSTRENTGVGVPQLTAIINCAQAKLQYPSVSLIADGGIQTPGDIAKALAAGADAVMLGQMLAGHDESPGELIDPQADKYNWGLPESYSGPPQKLKAYRGQSLLGSNGARNAPEGVSGYVPYRGPVENTINTLMNYLRSSMSYVGARNLAEFRQNAAFIEVSPATFNESRTRL